MIFGIKEKCIILTHTISYCYKYSKFLHELWPVLSWKPPWHSLLLIFNNSVHNLLHLLAERRRVRRKLLRWRATSLLLSFAVVVSLSSARSGRDGVWIPLAPPLPSGFLVSHFVLDLLQGPVLDGLGTKGSIRNVQQRTRSWWSTSLTFSHCFSVSESL